MIDPGSDRMSEMSISIHPLNNQIVLSSANCSDSYDTFYGTGYYISTDGGLTWNGDEQPPADVARIQKNVTGANIKVGVISDGIQGYFNSLNSEDLNGLTVLPGHISMPDSEGLAMAEIIQDLAPEAQIHGKRPIHHGVIMRDGKLINSYLCTKQLNTLVFGTLRYGRMISF